MLKREYLELHKKLKERIKGQIYIGVNNKDDRIMTVNIKGFKGTIYKHHIYSMSKDKDSINHMANQIEFSYRNFVLSKFFNKEG